MVALPTIVGTNEPRKERHEPEEDHLLNPSERHRRTRSGDHTGTGQPCPEQLAAIEAAAGLARGTLLVAAGYVSLPERDGPALVTESLRRHVCVDTLDGLIATIEAADRLHLRYRVEQTIDDLEDGISALGWVVVIESER